MTKGSSTHQCPNRTGWRSEANAAEKEGEVEHQKMAIRWDGGVGLPGLLYSKSVVGKVFDWKVEWIEEVVEW